MICDIAYSEVNFIISKMSKELREKIPIELIEFIQNRDNKQHKINSESVKDIELHEDTKKILSVIYTDYIATEEERTIIKNKEKLIELKRENEKKEKFGVEVFKNKENNNDEITKTTMLIKFKEKWYQKLFEKIKKILNKFGE